MAQTQKDKQLKIRIENIIKQNTHIQDKELIHLIAGVCGVSFRTASEHFHNFKSQQNLSEFRFKDDCIHQWSNAFSTPGGLMKECVLCHETKFVEAP